MKKAVFYFVFALLFTGTDVLMAQKKVLNVDDYPLWARIVGTKISDDGGWMVYGRKPNAGDDTLYVQSLTGDKKFEVPNAAAAEFTADGQWVLYTITPDKQERKKLQDAKKPVYNTAELLNLSTGNKIKVERAASHTFSNNSQYWVVLRKKEGNNEAKGNDLIVRNLKSGETLNIGNVSEYAFNKKSSSLAYLVDADDKIGNGVYTFNTGNAAIRALDTDTLLYEGLKWDDAGVPKTEWSKKGTGLAVLKGEKSEKAEYKENALLVITNVETTPVKKVLNPGQVPDDLILSEDRALSWSDDGSRVFAGLRAQEEKITFVRDSTANVDVWHWKDPKIQTVQMQQYNRDSKFTYVAGFSLKSGKMTRLTDDDMRTLTLNGSSDYMIGENDKPYIDDTNWGLQPVDLYRVNLETGQRTKIDEVIGRKLGYSPDGRYYLYQKTVNDVASLLLYDLKNGKTTDLTADSPVRFDDAEYIYYQHEKPPYGLAGWTKDGKNVIVNHKYDLWMLALDGSKATNITKGEGDKNKIVFRYLSPDSKAPVFSFMQQASRQEYIDTKEDLLLSAYGDLTKKSGFYSLKVGSSPKQLVLGDYKFGIPLKGEKSDNILVTRQTFVDFPDYYLTNKSFKNLKKVTDANPQQAEYAWGSRKLIEFKNGKGRDVQGTLTLPANYEPGKRYPTIIYFYETMSERHNEYSMPVYDDRPHFSTYASNGYMVFMPDMYFEVGKPGTSSLDGITSAAQAIIDQGYADPDNIGLQGHSWSGYQTSFILTQTDMFKTIVTGAPPTDLESFYNNIYGSTGTNHHGIMENGQVRMGRGVTPWSDPETYRRENPMVHVPNIKTPFMILHGTADGAVDWAQGMEFYNAARRNGKEVIFLSYPNEGHHLTNLANQIDFQKRMKEFFDYHLMGAEAPDWMINGVPQLEKKYRKAK